MSEIANVIWKPEPQALGTIDNLRKNMLVSILNGSDPDQAFEDFYTLALDEFAAQA